MSTSNHSSIAFSLVSTTTDTPHALKLPHQLTPLNQTKRFFWFVILHKYDGLAIPGISPLHRCILDIFSSVVLN